MDIIGNTVPENMIEAETRLDELSEATIREAETWNWHIHTRIDVEVAMKAHIHEG